MRTAPDVAPLAASTPASDAVSAQRLRALHEAVLALAVPVDGDAETMAPLLTGIVARAVNVLGAVGGVVALAEHPAWLSLVPGTTSADGHVMLRDTGQAERRQHRPGGTALRALQGEGSHVADTTAPEHGGAYNWLAAAGVRSFVNVPLRTVGSPEVLGALIMNFANPGVLPVEDRQVLELFAAHAAAAVDRARHAYVQSRRIVQSTLMAETLSRVAAAETVEGALEQLLRGAMRLFNGSAATARLIDPGTGGTLISMDLGTGGAPRRTLGGGPPAPGTYAAMLAAGGPSVLVDDFATLPDSYPLRAKMLAEGRRAALIVPIDAAGRRSGSLHVNHVVPGALTPADLALAEALASLAGAAIERARLEAFRAERGRLDAALLVARTVSHEINNALTPITGYAELLSLNPTITADDLLVTFARRILWASVDVTEKVKRLQQIIRLEETPESSGTAYSVLDLTRSTTAGEDATDSFGSAAASAGQHDAASR